MMFKSGHTYEDEEEMVLWKNKKQQEPHTEPNVPVVNSFLSNVIVSPEQQ